MLALRNWRVASRLIVLVTIPAILGLTVAGLLAARAAGSAATYGQIRRVAALGQQVTDLAQALEGERDGAAMFIAGGRPAGGLPALRRQYAATDGWAARERRLVRELDGEHPLTLTRATAAAAVASIGALAALRQETAQDQASALKVIEGYTAAITGLFPVVDGIGDLSASPALTSSVRALGSLSRLKEQASRQQAILDGALADGRFEPGALTALTIAQAQQASELAAFRGSATSQESWALAGTLAGPQARQAQAVEQRAIAAGDGALVLGPQDRAQWQAGMSYTIGWLRHAEQQLADWITADARAQQQNATRSAAVTGGVALAGLIVTLLIALLIVRSVVRPLRRLEAATMAAVESRLPEEIGALTAHADSGHAVAALPVDVSSGDEIGQLERAVARLQQEAVRMAGEEARLRDSFGVMVAGLFRRSHSLHDRLLRLIDSAELTEDDPERLARLFEMDSLATRMRRHSDTALVLSGHETPLMWTEPVALVDVLRAAASEIERYERIAFDVQPEVLVSEDAAVDTVHLLAELLENATAFSPETTQVIVSGFLDLRGGALISVADAGPGLPDGRVRWLNWRLAHAVPADASVLQEIGLFAVAHLAARHGISVVLTSEPGIGTTVEVHLPAEMIGQLGQPGDGGRELGADYGRGNGTSAVAPDPRPLAPEITAGPPAPPEGRDKDGTSAATPEGALEAGLPLTLGAPLSSSALTEALTAAGPEPADAALPGFDFVESEYLGARGPDRPESGARHAASLESARAARIRLAGFQQGSRRARAVAQMERDTELAPEDD